MSNNTVVSRLIIRLARSKASSVIKAGLTINNNATLTGTVMLGEEVIVEVNRTFVELSNEDVVGMRGVISIPNLELAKDVIDEINSVFISRVANNSNAPFVWVEVLCSSVGFSEPNTINKFTKGLILNEVKDIQVNDSMPIELIKSRKPQLRPTPSLTPQSTTRSFYDEYRPKVNGKSVLAQTQVAQESAAIANAVPSFNTKTVEIVKEKEGKQSEQYKLAAIASAMRAAGLSPLEIANALKEQVGV